LHELQNLFDLPEYSATQEAMMELMQAHMERDGPW
jgi:hypothetical protein